MNLIKFSNGKWGIRKGGLILAYMDFENNGCWWCKEDDYFKYCMVSELTARERFYKLTNKLPHSTITDEVIE